MKSAPGWRKAGLPDPATLSDDELVAMARAVMGQMDAERYDWARHARPEQQEPERYTTWLIMAGRGYGKTRTGAETVKSWALTRKGHYAVVGQTWRDTQSICFEGPSGLVAVIPKDQVTTYHRSGGNARIILDNGSIIRAFSAEKPDVLRGYAFDGAWIDEYAAVHRSVAADLYDQLWFCLREAVSPKVVITTTPRPVPHIKRLVEAAATDEHIVLTRGHTMDNAANLSPAALAELERLYAGTRLGRQELSGELLEDVENALWTQELCDTARAAVLDSEPQETIVSVDPSGSEHGDATGIITAARLADNRVAVLADDTCQGTPEQRYAAVCTAAHRSGAGTIVYEGAYGGDNIRYGIEQTWRRMNANGELPGTCPRLVHTPCKGSKADRAMPVVALYEQGRVLHAGPLVGLIEELTTWEPGSDWSPNRMDAMVHAVRHLTAFTPMVIGTPAGHRQVPNGANRMASLRIAR